MDAEFYYFIQELNKLVVNNPIPFLYYDTSAIPKDFHSEYFIEHCLGWA